MGKIASIEITGGLAAVMWVMSAVFASVALAAEGEEIEELGEEEIDAMETAEAHYRMAVDLYTRGRYRESVEEFDRVLELHDDPVVHCNRAVPLIELGRLVEARQSLRRCRASYDPESRDFAGVDADVEALDVTVDVVHPTAKAVADAMGSEPVVRAEPVAPPPAGEPSMATSQVLGLALMGTAVGLAGGAAVVDWQSAELVEAYRLESQGGEGTSPERHEELGRRIEARQRIFWGLAISGATAAVVGVGLFTWGSLRPGGQEGLHLQFSGDRIMAGWRTRF